MRKLAILTPLLVLLVVPAAAMARTPVRGSLKETLVHAAIAGERNTDHLTVLVDPRQARACFSAWTYRGFAFVVPSGETVKGLCAIQAVYNGTESGWQGVNLLLHETHGRWGLRAAFDQVEPQQLPQWGISLPVFENLINTKPPNYPWVP